MTISYHERPGVYSDYEASGLYAAQSGGKTVALAAKSTTAEGVRVLHSLADTAAFAAEQPLYGMLRLMFQNGAGTVLLHPVEEQTAAGYSAALQTLLSRQEAQIVLTDSTDASVAAAVKTAVEAASLSRNECIAVLGAEAETPAAYTAAAAALNSARVMLSAPACSCAVDPTPRAVYGAAALAGLLAGQSDPSLPLHGAELSGLTAVTTAWSEAELDQLIRGGVTALEYADGAVRVLRGVSTKTTENGQPDAAWREITTILIVDDVISGVRSSLQRRFSRAKNNAQTRSAIRDQVVMELENRVRREIIEHYGDLTVQANADDPTICDVIFSFGVSHGLRCILLSAHITV